MAPFARVVAIDAPHHITQRGNARQVVFEGDADRLVYLDLLADSMLMALKHTRTH
jgi:putative transposase